MIILLMFIGITIVLPVLIVFVRKNLWTLLLCYVPVLLASFIYIRRLCAADHYSEACTWGYMSYGLALTLGFALYFTVTLIQIIYGYFKKPRADDFE